MSRLQDSTAALFCPHLRNPNWLEVVRSIKLHTTAYSFLPLSLSSVVILYISILSMPARLMLCQDAPRSGDLSSAEGVCSCLECFSGYPLSPDQLGLTISYLTPQRQWYRGGDHRILFPSTMRQCSSSQISSWTCWRRGSLRPQNGRSQQRQSDLQPRSLDWEVSQIHLLRRRVPYSPRSMPKNLASDFFILS